MRQARRTFKFLGQFVLGDEDAAALEFLQGSERDAAEDEEKNGRSQIIKMEESQARLLIEASIMVEAHRERIERVTRTPDGLKTYAFKVAESIKRAEEEAYEPIIQTFHDERRKILAAAAFEQSEHTARELIENQAMEGYAFFEHESKQIGLETHAFKVAESIKKAEEEAYEPIIQTFHDERRKILTAAFEQSEHTARERIENQAMKRYAFFAHKSKQTHDLLATEQLGFHVIDPCRFSDEEDFESTILSATK